jgi:ATP:ADP antiporter, AAA family
MTTRPIRDALVVEGDPDRIPWLFSASFFIFIAITPLWGTVVRRSPRRIVPAALHVCALGSLAFALIARFNIGYEVTPYAFYIWAAVYNQFIVSVFWSLLADLVGPTTARTLYGPISAGGTIGAFAGPLLTKFLVEHIDVSGVMLLPVIFLELAIVGIIAIRRIGHRLESGEVTRGSDAKKEPEGDREDAPLPENAWAGITRTARSRYLSALAGFTLLTAVAATFVYYTQANVVKLEFPNKVAKTEYFATLEFWQQLATFVVQLLIAPLLLRRIGPGPVLCLLPLLQLAGLIGYWLAPSLALIAAVHVLSRTVALGLTRPARELCFTVIHRDEKYRAKNVIDTLMYRGGDFVSAWTFFALGLGASLVSLSVVLTAGWIALAVAIGIGFRRRTKEST